MGPKSRFYENGEMGEHRRGLNLEEALEANRHQKAYPTVATTGASENPRGFSDFHWGPFSWKPRWPRTEVGVGRLSGGNGLSWGGVPVEGSLRPISF